MNKRQNRQITSMRRSKRFVEDHQSTVAGTPAAMAAFESLSEAIEQVEILEAERVHGTSTFRSAAEERVFRRKQLRSALSDLSRVSKTLDRQVHPDLAEQLKMGRLNSNADLLAYARNAIAVMTPIKAVFIAHGASENFLEEIQALIAAFEASGDRRNHGIGNQIRCNAGLPAAIRAGMHQIRVLDAVLSLKLRGNLEALAAWKAAMRVGGNSRTRKGAGESSREGTPVDDSVGAVAAANAEGTMEPIASPSNEPRQTDESPRPPSELRS